MFQAGPQVKQAEFRHPEFSRQRSICSIEGWQAQQAGRQAPRPSGRNTQETGIYGRQEIPWQDPGDPGVLAGGGEQQQNPPGGCRQKRHPIQRQVIHESAAGTIYMIQAYIRTQGMAEQDPEPSRNPTHPERTRQKSIAGRQQAETWQAGRRGRRVYTQRIPGPKAAGSRNLICRKSSGRKFHPE